MDDTSDNMRRLLRELAVQEYRLLHGRRSMTASTGSAMALDQPLGTVVACPVCGEPRTLAETRPNCIGRTLRFWTDCACVTAAVARAKAICEDATHAIRGSRDEAAAFNAGAYDIEHLERTGALTLEQFDPTRLADSYPYEVAIRWLTAIQAANVLISYRGEGPPAALFFHGPRGRGKTHLAIALLLKARSDGRRVAILNEKKYLHQTRTVPFGPPLEALVSEPGERAWLTVIDDIGKHRCEDERDRARLQNAWYSVLDRRYNARRWTVFTSEKTLDQLAHQGTIDDSLYGRIYEMTRGACLHFDGPDQRLIVERRRP
jgi:hypothetical protein